MTKRMFSPEIIYSDHFLSLPLAAQGLYFHLCMHADDDGFIKTALAVIQMIRVTPADFEALNQKNYLISFEGGVCVVKHWKMHNYIRTDRYRPTICKKERAMLVERDGEYHLATPENTDVAQDTLFLVDAEKRSLEKSSLDQCSLEECREGEGSTPPTPLTTQDTPVNPKKKSPSTKSTAKKKKLPKAPEKTVFAEFVTMTEKEYGALVERLTEPVAKACIEILDNYKGASGKIYRSDYRAILHWVIEKYQEEQQKKQKTVLTQKGKHEGGNPFLAMARALEEQGL